MFGTYEEVLGRQGNDAAAEEDYASKPEWGEFL
jgi:hypothetical protein